MEEKKIYKSEEEIYITPDVNIYANLDDFDKIEKKNTTNNIHQKIIDMQEMGASPEYLQKYREKKAQELRDVGASQKEIYKILNNKHHPDTIKQNPEVQKAVNGYWDSIWEDIKKNTKEFKESAIGPSFQLSTERAFGPAIYNETSRLIDKKYGTNFGVDYDKALQEQGVGWLEKGIEGFGTILADLPVYAMTTTAGVIAGAPAGPIGIASGFGLGLKTPGTLRSIINSQLKNGNIDKPSQFWDLTVKEALPAAIRNNPEVLGLIEGGKAEYDGLREAAQILTVGGKILPKGLPNLDIPIEIIKKLKIPKNFLTEYLAKVGTWITAGAALDQEIPSLEQIGKEAVVFLALGGLQKSTVMFKNKVMSEEKSAARQRKEILEDPIKKYEIIAKNRKTFSEDRAKHKDQADILNKELLEIKKSLQAEKNTQTRQEKIKRAEQIQKDIRDIDQVSLDLKIEQELKSVDIKDSVVSKAQENLSKVTKRGFVRRNIDKTKEFLSDLEQNWDSSMAPIEKIVKEAEKIGVKDFQKTYELFRLQRGMVGRGEHFVKMGVLDFKTQKVVPIGGKEQGLFQILKSGGVFKNEKTYVDFGDYAIAARVLELEAKGQSTKGFNLQDMKTIYKKYNKKYDKTYKFYNEYKLGTLKYLRDSGLVSTEKYNAIVQRVLNHTEFHRHFTTEMKKDVVKDKDSFRNSVRDPLRDYKGDKNAILDPIETTYKNTYMFIQMAEKNRAINDFFKGIDEAKAIEYNGSRHEKIDQTISDLYKKEKTLYDELKIKDNQLEAQQKIKKEIDNLKEKFSKLYEEKQKLPPLKFEQFDKPKAKPITVTAKETKTALEKQGVIPPELKDFEIFRKPQEKLTETQVEYYDINSGKRIVRNVDKKLAIAINDLNPFMGDMYRKIMKVPASWLRAGATLSPSFMLKNLIRGGMSAQIFSKNNYWMIYDDVIGAASYYVGKKYQTQAFKDWTKSGVLQSSLISIDRNYIRQAEVQKQIENRTLYNQRDKVNVIEHLRDLSELSENPARYRDFQLSMKRLKKEFPDMPYRERIEKSGFGSREVGLDFQDLGLKMASINQHVTFLGAFFKGVKQIVKGAMNPRTAKKMAKALIITQTAPAILAWFAQKDDPEYIDYDKKTKEQNIVIFINGQPYKYPILWELGYIAATIPVQALDFWYRNGYKDAINKMGKELKEGAKSYAKTIPSKLISTGLLPIVENLMNYDIHRGAPVVGAKEERIFPDAVHSQYASETAKLIGKGIRDLPLIGDDLESFTNPLHLQNIINDYFASLGSVATSGIDMILNEMGIGEQIQDPWSNNFVDNLEKLPVIRGFVARGNNSQSIKTFWKNYSMVKKQLDTVRYLRREGKFAEANRYLVEKYGKKEGTRAIKLQFLQDYGDVMSLHAKKIRGLHTLTEVDATKKGISPQNAYDSVEDSYRSMIRLSKKVNAAVARIMKKTTND